MALLKPGWSPTSAEERERIHRFNIFQVAKILHISPEEVEDMDYSWYVDIPLFEHTEQLVAKIKK